MPFPITNLWVQPLGSTAIQPHAILDEAGILWAVCVGSSPGVLIRLDPANPSAFSTITFPNDGLHNAPIDLIYIAARDKVYVLFENSILAGHGTVVSEVDPATQAHTDVISDSSHDCGEGSLCSDGAYIYVSTAVFLSDFVTPIQSYLLKYSIPGWGFVSSLTLNYGGQHLLAGHNCKYDGASVFITSAAADLVTNLAVVRVDSSSFTVVAGSSLPSNANALLTNKSDFTASYIWCGSESSGNVVRFDKATLLSQTPITTGLASTAGPAPCWGVYNDGTYLWLSSGATPGMVGRLDPNTLAVVLFSFPLSSQFKANKMVSDGTNMYFSYYQSPGILSAAPLDGLDWVAEPAFTPVAGTYSETQNVAIATTTPGATIRYTEDGTNPSESVGTVYIAPVVVGATETLKAIAYLSGWPDSVIASAVYDIDAHPPGPTSTAAAAEQARGVGTATLIPLTNAPNQSMTVSLPINGGSLTLKLNIRYNENGANGNFWVMNVSDRYGNLMVASVPLVTGVWPAANVLAPFDYLRIGSAYVVNQSAGALDIPDDQTLGGQFVLLWGPNV